MYKSHRGNGHKQLLSYSLCFALASHRIVSHRFAAFHLTVPLSSHSVSHISSTLLRAHWVTQSFDPLFELSLFVPKNNAPRIVASSKASAIFFSVISPLRTAIFLYIENYGWNMDIREFGFTSFGSIKMKIFHVVLRWKWLCSRLINRATTNQITIQQIAKIDRIKQFCTLIQHFHKEKSNT